MSKLKKLNNNNLMMMISTIPLVKRLYKNCKILFGNLQNKNTEKDTINFRKIRIISEILPKINKLSF
jgi:hypothetical protein